MTFALLQLWIATTQTMDYKVMLARPETGVETFNFPPTYLDSQKEEVQIETGARKYEFVGDRHEDR